MPEMKWKKLVVCLVSIAAAACGTPDEERGDLLEYEGGLHCTNLEALTAPTTLEAECTRAGLSTVTVTAESGPLRASVQRVYEALMDPEQFGALPRPLPPGFEPPPVPHSVSLPSSGAPFLAHFRLFYGALQTSTVREVHTVDSIEIVQLWRVNPQWTEQEVRSAYPALGQAEVEQLVGTPFMEAGLRTIVTFTLRRVPNSREEYSYVSLVQRGLPEQSYPIVQQHWMELYLGPLRAYLASAAQ
jgi:hypothetical protein